MNIIAPATMHNVDKNKPMIQITNHGKYSRHVQRNTCIQVCEM